MVVVKVKEYELRVSILNKVFWFIDIYLIKNESFTKRFTIKTLKEKALLRWLWGHVKPQNCKQRK